MQSGAVEPRATATAGQVLQAVGLVLKTRATYYCSVAVLGRAPAALNFEHPSLALDAIALLLGGH